MYHKKKKHASALVLATASTLYASWVYSEDDIKFKKKGGLSAETANGDLTFQVSGRLQADAAFYDEGAANLGNGTELRRIRFGVAGTFFRDWAYKSVYDFAGEEVSLADVYLQYLGVNPLVITAGHFKQPFSLENMTSPADITFMERALVYEAFITPSRRDAQHVDHEPGRTAMCGGAPWVQRKRAADQSHVRRPRLRRSDHARSGARVPASNQLAPAAPKTLSAQAAHPSCCQAASDGTPLALTMNNV
jgi:phosphate-selective porin